MIDPGALGTLLIGLRANEAKLDFGTETDHPEPRVERDSRPVFAIAARELRRLADRLEPAPLEAGRDLELPAR